MKNFLLAVIENTQPLSKKLLFTCFISGYFLATIFFRFFGPEVHRFLNSILQGL
jgi:hypothetical protein